MTLGKESGRTSTRIALIGLGGTGCALLPLLCALPVDGITVVDGDTVEARNLGRQLLYTPADLGRPKVECGVARQRPVSSRLHLAPEFRFVDAGNCVSLLQGHQLAADCTDDLSARALIERTCRALGIPLVSGAVHGRQVQVITSHGVDHRRHGPGFFQGAVSEDQLGCDMRSVPAAVTTLTASLMALRMEDLLNGGDGLAGVMDLIDTEHGRWMRIMGPDAGEFMDTPIAPTYRA